MSSNLQLLANRENARRSTGPRTPKGKKRSSLNALRHGLTGQIVVLPEEDMARYQAFCQEYLDEWQPKGPTEKNLVQTLADQQWRLHRAHARERGVYALGSGKYGDTVLTENAEVHTLLTASTVDLELGLELERLSRYASRIQRDYHNTLKELKALQSERKAREKSEELEAGNIQRLMQMQEIPWDPASDGFVLSNDEINVYLRRQQRTDEAWTAHRVAYNKQRFLAAGGHLENPS